MSARKVHVLERRHEPLAPPEIYHRRIVTYFSAALALIGVSLGLGVLGYHAIAGLPWLDALVNASMILAGMGPVDPVTSTGGKWFASGYAIFSGITFLTSVSVMLAPIAHRTLHRFHLEMDDGQSRPDRGPKR